MLIIKYIPVLIAAMLLGNWFMAEVKKSKTRGEKWYKPYFSLPGILILLALFIPILYALIK